MLERLENPVFRQSSRQRMRGGKTYGCLIAYLLVLGLVVVISYEQFVSARVFPTTTGLAQVLFDTLVTTQWFLVAIITPALTATAITMEREQRTFDLLLLTPLSRFAIVWGKFLSAMAFVVVMVVCGTPLVALLFWMGGIDLWAALERYALILLSGVLLASFGLTMSAICSTSTLSILLTYGAFVSNYFVILLAGVAMVVARAFGGGAGLSLTALLPSWSAWQVWAFGIGATLLATWLQLQIAANYLLPDPRQGAWKTRLLTGALFLLALTAAVSLGRGAAASTANIRQYMVIVCTMFLVWTVPMLATGVPLQGRRWIEWLHPRSLQVGSVQSVPLFVALLLLMGIVADQFLPAPLRSSPLAWAYAAAYLWWVWALGYFYSFRIRNRWGALFALIGTLYFFAQVFANLANAFDRRVWFYLAGVTAPVELFDQPSDFAVWVPVYLILGLLSVWSTNLLERRRERRLQQGSTR
ncbi:MAG: ABC transporter permease [bacterium]|nr:ABC transporter permease [bacterium]